MALTRRPGAKRSYSNGVPSSAFQRWNETRRQLPEAATTVWPRSSPPLPPARCIDRFLHYFICYSYSSGEFLEQMLQLTFEQKPGHGDTQATSF